MTQQISQDIQLLPEHIIDQIKAGEVIERPSTLLKEIIENSIDAGSTKIDLHLIDNGLDLISIKDNGKGIKAQDLALAFCRHATSKIERFEDIYALSSYGFRGEALASIASISKISCESTTQDSSGIIKIEGGLTTSHIEETGEYTKTGTNIHIKELFYNTPARLKFIQSKTSEKNQLKKIINAFLLTHPQIEFSIKWDDNDKEIYKAYTQEGLLSRAKDVVSKKGEKIEMLEAQAQYDGSHFQVFLTRNSSRGNAHKSHYLFINDRYVQDIQIHKIILNSSKDLWPEGETGSYLAYLSIPSDEIDVNVHPNKTVVKLFRAPKTYSLISGTIKNQLSLDLRDNGQVQSLKSPVSEAKLPLDITKDDFKSIDYGSYDFNSPSSLDSYFDNLHSIEKSSSPTNQIEELVSDFSSFSLYKIRSTLFLLKKSSLISLFLTENLSKAVSSEEMIPLLVSRPIKVEKKISEKVLTSFQTLGFELDALDNETIVIRSFPKKLQGFPYIRLVENLLKENKSLDETSLNTIKLEDSQLEDITPMFIKKIFKDYPISQLIESGVLKKINEKDLKKLL